MPPPSFGTPWFRTEPRWSIGAEKRHSKLFSAAGVPRARKTVAHHERADTTGRKWSPSCSANRRSAISHPVETRWNATIAHYYKTATPEGGPVARHLGIGLDMKITSGEYRFRTRYR